MLLVLIWLSWSKTVQKFQTEPRKPSRPHNAAVQLRSQFIRQFIEKHHNFAIISCLSHRPAAAARSPSDW